jgi:hypothetical protein
MILKLAILLGGYAFIALSVAWTWVVCAVALPAAAPRRARGFSRQDGRMLLRILLGWTVLCAGFWISDAWV